MSAPAARARGWALLLAATATLCLFVPRSEWWAAAAVPQSWPESDYQIHRAAARVLDAGGNPYDSEALNTFGREPGPGSARAFTPFCAAAPLPLSGFAWIAARYDFDEGYRVLLRVQRGLTLLSAALLALALRRMLSDGASDGTGARLDARWRAACATLPGALGLAGLLVVGNDALWMAVWFNQLDLVALAALCGALLAALAKRPRLEGLLLAVATAAKLSPGLLVVVAAAQGRWRTVAAAGAAGAALVLLSIGLHGVEVHAHWLAMLRAELGYVAERPAGLFNNSLHAWNLSPNGLLSRAAEAAGWSLSVTRAAVTVLALGIAVVILAAARRARTAPDAVAHGYALGVAAGFAISGTTWVHHLCLAALPLAWLASAWLRGGLSRAALAGATLAALVLLVPLGISGDPQLVAEVRGKSVAVLLLPLLLAGAVRRPSAA